MDDTEKSGDALLDDVVASKCSHAKPGYAMPTITAILPEYTNAESEHLYHAFNQGSYTSLQALPEHLRCHEINRRRAQVIEAVRNPLPGGAPTTGSAGPSGLFQEFDYIPEQYNREDMLAEQERLDNHAKREKAHPGTDWAPVGVIHKAKYESLFNTNEKGCEYEAGANPYEASKDMILRHLWMEQQKVLEGPWKPGGVDKPLSQPPGPQMQGDIIASVQRLLEEDWEDVVVNIFENQDGHWVVRFDLETVDSEQGLATYMNVFLRCNALVTKYGLQRVTEHFNVKPGDGFIYFTLKPPWVKTKTVAYTPPTR